MIFNKLNFFGFQIFTSELKEVALTERLIISTLNAHCYNMAYDDSTYKKLTTRGCLKHTCSYIYSWSSKRNKFPNPDHWMDANDEDCESFDRFREIEATKKIYIN